MLRAELRAEEEEEEYYVLLKSPNKDENDPEPYVFLFRDNKWHMYSTSSYNVLLLRLLLVAAYKYN